MQLITDEIREKAPLYSQENKPASEVPIIAKFFVPWSYATWYVTEYSEVAPDGYPHLAFGYVVLNLGDAGELGYISIDELEELRGPGGLRVERDLHFGEHTLAEVMNGGRP